MKKAIIALAITITSINCYSQKKDSVPPLPQVNDTTPLLNLNDIKEIDALLQKTFSIADFQKYEVIAGKINQLLSIRIKQYQSTTTPKK